jgi:hypothetical protein
LRTGERRPAEAGGAEYPVNQSTGFVRIHAISLRRAYSLSVTPTGRPSVPAL